jgi:hypothetical protein
VRNHRRTSQDLGVDANDMVHDRLSTPEDVRGHSGGGHLAILVLNLVDVSHIQDVDVGDIADVRDVDTLKVFVSVVIPRQERFSGTEWKPRSEFRAEADAKGKTRPADKCDECRRVHRHRNVRTRQPSPHGVNENPAPIVKRTEAPHVIIDPGPAPRIDPSPVAEAIWHPAGGNTVRIPNGAVVADFLPMPVVVQVVVSDRSAAYIFRGLG